MSLQLKGNWPSKLLASIETMKPKVGVSEILESCLLCEPSADLPSESASFKVSSFLSKLFYTMFISYTMDQ